MGLLKVLAKLTGDEALDEGGEDVINQLFDFTINYRKLLPDANPAATTTDLLIWTNPFDCNVKLVSGRVVAIGAGVAPNATDYAKISFKTDDANASVPLEALSITTTPIDSGPLASLISKLLSKLTPSAAVLVPGANLYLDIAKLGAGVVIPQALFTLRLRKQG